MTAHLPRSLAVPAIAVALVAAACGGDGSGGGIASLEGAPTTAGAERDATLDAEERDATERREDR